MGTNIGHGQQVARTVSDQARASLKRLALIVIVGLFVVSFFVAHSTSVLAKGGHGTWSAAGSMTTAREFHTATLLTGGQVLVAGGDQTTWTSISIASVELYNPSSDTWSTTSSMAQDRASHTATLLGNGEVLVAGGWHQDQSTFARLASAELYDPTTSTWSTTGSMSTGRSSHTATLLNNGEVLVAGGVDARGAALASAELYNPAIGTWSTTGSMSTARWDHTATLLGNGQVLVAGGQGSSGAALASAELYTPATGTWSATGSMTTAREFHTATLLTGGQVLVAGGQSSYANVFASAELYDPSSGTWSATGSMSTAREFHTATLLTGGQVLVAGGYPSSPLNALASAELYNPASGTWSATGSMTTARYYYTATLLSNGQVLAAGGDGGITSAELYLP